MKPTDLDDVLPVEPDDELLARVRMRSASFRRHRSAQRLTSVVSGLLVLALAGGIAWSRVDNSKTKLATPAPNVTSTTTGAAPAAVTETVLEHDWWPVSIAGYSGPLTQPPLPYPPHLRFNGAGRWSGSDGCNDIAGTYELGSDGAINLAFGQSTAVLCSAKTPTPGSLFAAARVELRDGQLTFLAADGRELAQYVRATVTARLDLPSTTMTAGSSMAGHVVVENNTGHVLKTTGCGSLFAVTLSNANVQPGNPAFPLCRMDFTIPTGESTYPVSVPATYLSCSATPQPGFVTCLPNNAVPPLPLGDYDATLFEQTQFVVPPPPITVHVLPEVATVASPAGLQAAALDWSRAFLTGTADDIRAMEGPECAPVTATTFNPQIVSDYLQTERRLMRRQFGVDLDRIEVLGVSVRNFKGTSGEAVVHYDLPESKTGNDNWVTYTLHGGAWKVSDCNAPIGGSSTSSASSGPLG